jgi:hypothetical protein
MSSGKRQPKRRNRRKRQRRSDRRPSASTDGPDDDPAAVDAEPSEQAGGEGDTQTDDDLQVSRVLIREAASLDNFTALNNTASTESQIARGRGRAELIELHDGAEEQEERRTAGLQFDQGQLQIETDYIMHFVEEAHLDLPIYDIISIPDTPCYPVSQTTLESLPRWAQAKLERQGHLKCSGVYDRPTKEFFSVRLGWEDYPQNTADVLAEILQEYDGERLARSVYYFLYEYSDKYSDPEAIAELRGIQESSVQGEIKKAIDELDVE